MNSAHERPSMNIYRILCILLMTLTAATLLAAIWAPGHWWQWLLTGAVFLYGGSYCLSEVDKREDV